MSVTTRALPRGRVGFSLDDLRGEVARFSRSRKPSGSGELPVLESDLEIRPNLH